MSPISGKGIALFEARQVLLIKSNVAHRWNYKENSELLGEKPVSLYFIHNCWLWVEAGSLRWQAGD